jgi:hypothetical protein
MAWNAFGSAWGGTPSANQSGINAMTKLVTTQPFSNIRMGLDWYLSSLRNGATTSARAHRIRTCARKASHHLSPLSQGAHFLPNAGFGTSG